MLKQSAERNAIVIRPARAEESEAVAALIHRAFAPYRRTLEPAPSALSETAGSIQSAMAAGTVLVAVREGQIAGCVSVERRGDSVYAGRPSVDAAVRGTGIGGALMADVERLARQGGAARVRVDVRLALTGNRAFFRRLGFAEGRRRCHPGFTGPTYVELEKILV
ncbi:MAG TPA: GNAT family N-acetyltransferase [Dongiaceae bacterium]|nr:GNAT family N-acetyltransferase [Dongiaceae bacterium]